MIAVTLTLLGLVLGCAGTGINKGDFSLISIEEEWQLGAQFSVDIAKEMRLIEDPEIKAYITRLGQDVLAQAGGDTPIAAQPWNFHVIAEDQVNAFNIPGGHVYFYSGLISRADNYGELMGVMAHEVSHGLARHGVENMSKQYGISIVASLVLGQNPKVYQEVLANILAGGAIMKFSRGAEAEADRLGAGYMYHAGADPMGMVMFFQKLLDLRPAKPERDRAVLLQPPAHRGSHQRHEDADPVLPRQIAHPRRRGFATVQAGGDRGGGILIPVASSPAERVVRLPTGGPCAPAWWRGRSTIWPWGCSSSFWALGAGGAGLSAAGAPSTSSISPASLCSCLPALYLAAARAAAVDPFRAPVLWARGGGERSSSCFALLVPPPGAWIYLAVGGLDLVWAAVHRPSGTADRSRRRSRKCYSFPMNDQTIKLTALSHGAG